jgi:hypothetical protein
VSLELSFVEVEVDSTRPPDNILHSALYTSPKSQRAMSGMSSWIREVKQEAH